MPALLSGRSVLRPQRYQQRRPTGLLPRLQLPNFLRRACPRVRSESGKSSRAMRSGDDNSPPMRLTSPAELIPRWRLPVPTGITIDKESIVASAAIQRCSLQKPSSIQAPAGQASGSRSRGKMLWSWRTGASVCGRLLRAPDATRTWDTFLTMALRLPVYGTA